MREKSKVKENLGKKNEGREDMAGRETKTWKEMEIKEMKQSKKKRKKVKRRTKKGRNICKEWSHENKIKHKL